MPSTPQSARRSAALSSLAALGLALVAGGCDLFDTREPFPPIGDIPRHVPNAPDSVLYNFEVALEYRIAGSSQLSEALGPQFFIALDPPDANRLGGLELVGKPDVERAVRDFMQLRVRNASVRMTMDNVTVRPTGTADSAFYDDLPYTLEIFREGDVLERVAGFADLSVTVQQNGNWAFQRWVDIGDQDDLTETFGYYMGFYSGLTAPRVLPK
jgi:hypothetical protein